MGTFAEVGATLLMRLQETEPRRYGLAGLGEVKVSIRRRGSAGQGGAVCLCRQPSPTELVVALPTCSSRRWGRRDATLIHELAEPDARRQEMALRVLADRKSPRQPSSPHPQAVGR